MTGIDLIDLDKDIGVNPKGVTLGMIRPVI
jgi:hypothetical protein